MLFLVFVVMVMVEAFDQETHDEPLSKENQTQSLGVIINEMLNLFNDSNVALEISGIFKQTQTRCNRRCRKRRARRKRIAKRRAARKEVATCLKSHNDLRNLHQSTPNMVWDNDLAKAAQDYANKLVEINSASRSVKLVHQKPSNGMGENLYWRDNKQLGKCAHASLAWYNEIDDYSYNTASSTNGQPIGHFTQLVWRDSVRVGFGIATMNSRKYSEYGNKETFIVAKYSPRGNIYVTGQKLQKYTDQVRPRKSGAVTPTVEELDPSLKQACEDVSDSCDYFLGGNPPLYTCTGDFQSYFKANCFKTCGYC